MDIQLSRLSVGLFGRPPTGGFGAPVKTVNDPQMSPAKKFRGYECGGYLKGRVMERDFEREARELRDDIASEFSDGDESVAKLARLLKCEALLRACVSALEFEGLSGHADVIDAKAVLATPSSPST